MASHLVPLGSLRKNRRVRLHGNSKQGESVKGTPYRVIRSRLGGDARTVLRSLRTGRVYSFPHTFRVFARS